MGFGVLFIGYAVTFGSAFFQMYVFADIVGCAVMIASLVMLMQYNRTFKFPAMAAGVLAMIYVAAAIMRIMGYNGIIEGDEVARMGEKLYEIIQYAISIVALIYDMLLLAAITALAKDVDFPDIVKKCRIWIIVLCAYFSVWTFFSTLQYRIAEIAVRVYNVLASGLNLFHAIWLVMMIVLILSCLKWIAPAEVVEAEHRGEEIEDNNALTKLGGKLSDIEKRAKTPREDKETVKMKQELDLPVKKKKRKKKKK